MIFLQFFSEITLFSQSFHNIKNTNFALFWQHFKDFERLVINHGGRFLSGYSSSVYKVKKSYNYANVFQYIMLNLITELF